MDTKNELLKTVVNALINEDDAGASVAFKQYATLKARGILEGDVAPLAVEEVAVVESEAPAETDAETAAKEILATEGSQD